MALLGGDALFGARREDLANGFPDRAGDELFDGLVTPVAGHHVRDERLRFVDGASDVSLADTGSDQSRFALPAGHKHIAKSLAVVTLDLNTICGEVNSGLIRAPTNNLMASKFEGELADRLKTARFHVAAARRENVSQARMAELVSDASGRTVHQTQWGRYEAGESEPPLSVIRATAKVSGLSEVYIAFGYEAVGAKPPAVPVPAIVPQAPQPREEEEDVFIPNPLPPRPAKPVKRPRRRTG